MSTKTPVLPSSGGSYTRTTKGGLKQSEQPTAEPPRSETKKTAEESAE